MLVGEGNPTCLLHFGLLACPRRIRRIMMTGGQLANPGLPSKWPLKRSVIRKFGEAKFSQIVAMHHDPNVQTDKFLVPT